MASAALSQFLHHDSRVQGADAKEKEAVTMFAPTVVVLDHYGFRPMLSGRVIYVLEQLHVRIAAPL